MRRFHSKHWIGSSSIVFVIVMLNIARDLARRLRQLDEHFCHVAH